MGIIFLIINNKIAFLCKIYFYKIQLAMKAINNKSIRILLFIIVLMYYFIYN